MNMKIKIGLDNHQYKSKPDNIDVAAIKARLTDNGNITVEPSSLPDFIKNGYTFCPAEVEPTLNEKGKLSHRAEGWRSQRLFCVDIDNADKTKQKLDADKYIPCSKAVEICENHGIALLFAYTTFSSKWGFDKYRLVVLLDETVTSPEERFKIVTAFMELFGDASDKSCINGDRIFFAGKSFPVPYTGKTTPKQVFLDLYDKSHPKTTTTATLSPSKPLNFSPPSSGVGNTYSPSDFDANPDTLLQMIDPNALQYDEWLGVTASFKAAGGSYEVWAAWSATYHNANARTDAQAWKGLTGDKHTVGTLKRFAKAHSPSLYDDYMQDLAAEQNMAIEAAKSAKKKQTQTPLDDKKKRNPVLDLDLFREWIKDKYDFNFDIVAHKTVFGGLEGRGHALFTETNAPTYLEQELKNDFDGVTIPKIERFLNVVVGENVQNPLLDRIKATKWDGKDRLQELFSILQIDESDRLSRIFIYKWLMQAVAMLHNGDTEQFSPEFVLVLQGRQGTGKTRLFQHLCPEEYWGEGEMIDPRDKDNLLRITSKWLCELGEIGSTMKKDVDNVKAFITRGTDECRPPYGKKTLKYPRKTVFVGTVNETEFLIDPTGSRRWAVVPLNPSLRIDYKTQIKPFDSWQLWSQIYYYLQEHLKQDNNTIGSSFRFTPQELSALEQRNAAHSKPMKAELEVLDVLAAQSLEESGYVVEWREMTVTEFREYNDELKRYSAAEIAKVLEKHGYTQKVVKRGASTAKLRTLPYKKSLAAQW